MSLVAYDASSDEDDAGEPLAAGPAPPPHLSSTMGPQPRPPSPSPSVHAAAQNTAPPPAPSQTSASTNSSNASLPAAPFELPDVADLFDSPSLPPGGFASMVGSSSRKRESNGSAIPPRSKFPGASQHSLVVPGMLRRARWFHPSLVEGVTLLPKIWANCLWQDVQISI